MTELENCQQLSIGQNDKHFSSQYTVPLLKKISDEQRLPCHFEFVQYEVKGIVQPEGKSGHKDVKC